MLKIIHRWLGLTIGLFLIVVSLSGSWLIYHREWRENEFLLNDKLKPLQLEKLYKNALAASGKAEGMVIRFPQVAKHPYQFWTMGKEQERIFVNQYTGEVLAKRSPDYWPYGWVFELHTSFLYGTLGEVFVGVMGLNALLVTIIGIVLWLPKSRNNLANNFNIRFRKNRYIRHYDLHKQIGIIVSPILVIIFLSGVSLVFSKEVSQLINWIAQSKITNSQNILASQNTDRVNLDSIIAKANQIMPGGRVGVVTVPADNKAIIVRKQMPDDPHPNGLNFIKFDANTGKILQVSPVSKADFAKKVFNWLYPLHTGQILKDWYYFILFLLGFIPSVLLFTAITTFSIRKLKRPNV